jgi:hypothetical protein
MPFAPRLPTFNLTVTRMVWDPLAGSYSEDSTPIPAQFYMGSKTNSQVWRDDFGLTVPAANAKWFEGGPMYCLFLVPKGTPMVDKYDVASRRESIVKYSHPDLGTRYYRCDQVEPRWAGFPNEHLVCICRRVPTGVIPGI